MSGPSVAASLTFAVPFLLVGGLLFAFALRHGRTGVRAPHSEHGTTLPFFTAARVLLLIGTVGMCVGLTQLSARLL